MKVLFISAADLPDFQSDMVFHGLRSLLGEDCIDANEMWYMYKDTALKYWNERVPNGGKSYGNGFTLYGKLENLKVDRSDLTSKIKSKFYDKIIYGSIHRCSQYLLEVTSNYSPKDVIFVDGEDHTQILESVLSFGVYYKRELVYEKTKNLKPINFSIPKDLIVAQVPKKVKDYGHIIPGDKSTYIFENERDYLQDYKDSYYGLTIKKGGWDCLRHYEILMSGCMPYFPDLENCPKNTMVLFPKNAIIENNKSLAKNGLSKNYDIEMNRLLNYTKTYLTTEYTAKLMLSNNNNE